MSEKRILHVLSSVVYRGAENVVCQIIHMFRDAPEYRFFYTSPDGVVRESLEEQGVDFRPMKAMNPMELKRIIREVNPTLIHAHDMRASFMASLVCGDIPVINHIHINNIDSRTITPKALAYVVAARKAKHIFWVSPSALEGYRFKESFRQKSQVLTNVIDPDLLLEKASWAQLKGKYDIVYMGAIVEQKNPARLGRVLSGVLAKRPETKIAVIGTGEGMETLRTVLKEQGTEDRVEILGFQRNPYGILKEAGLMIMTSDYEGTPMAALEALALGIPIVSTPVDGMCDLVEPGVSGLLAQGDQALVDACISVLEDAALRGRLSQGAKEKADALLDLKSYREAIEKAYSFSK